MLPYSSMFPEAHCLKKLIQILTKDDKIIRALFNTIGKGRPKLHENYEKDLPGDNDLIILDNKLVVPAVIRITFRSILHDMHLDRFEVKFPAEFIWGPHIFS